MIDIGANLLNPVFDADRQEVLQTRRSGRSRWHRSHRYQRRVKPGAAEFASRRGAVGEFGGAVVGRPDSAPLRNRRRPSPRRSRRRAGWDDAIAGLADRAEVVAIGETGLDYHRNFSPPEKQRAVFRRQVELAVHLDMPLFVHDRDTEGDTRAILADYRDDLTGCVIHCFTGTAADLEGYLDDGYYIGITGWICDERRGRQLMELVRRIPGDRLMIETDAPYLLPRNIVPRPRSRRNEPAFLTWVAQTVARCRDEDAVSVQRQTRTNAMRFFGVP